MGKRDHRIRDLARSRETLERYRVPGEIGSQAKPCGYQSRRVHTARAAHYGQSKPFVHDIIGHNNRLDSIQAAILKVKLKYLKDWNKARQRIAQTYISGLSDLPIKLPVERPNAKAVYHLFVVEIDRRDECITHLRNEGIMAQIHYPTPIHLQPCYKHLGYRQGDFPVTEAAACRILSLPIYAELTDRQIGKVISSLRNFVGG